MESELGSFISEFDSDMNKAISQEVSYQYDVLNTSVGRGVAVDKPTIKSTVALINQKPMVLNGKSISWSSRIGSYTPTQIRAVQQTIVAGWANGLTTTQISRNITGTKTINGVIQASQRDAFSMAKDTTSHMSSQSKARLAQDNQDIVIGEKAIVTLDSKTSPICQDYGSQDAGGKEWHYKEDGYNFPRSPYHYNCRTVMILLLAAEYRLQDDSATRPAVVDGESIQVPVNTNWMDLAKQHPTLAEQSLGKTKAAMLDNMSAKEFTNAAYNRMGQPMTLQEIAANNSKAMRVLQESQA
jgi:hypothetical protein